MKTFNSSVKILLLFVAISAWNSCYKTTPTSTPPVNEVFIQNMAFTPSTITVGVNTTVKWTNKDGYAHTVTSTGNLFDSGNLSNGGVYSHLFTTAGTYPYKCSIHSSMSGTVIVQ